jgi:hypothetical protein
MKRSTGIIAFASAVIALNQASNANVLSYFANLDGPSESPANASPGVGFATVDYDNTTHMLHLHVTFSGLTGTTTASHIHSATAVALTGTAGVATTTPTFAGFPLGVTSGTYDNTLDLTQSSSYNPSFITANGGTTATAEAALTNGIATSTAYLNIHTSTFGGGEIRGFLVPEPATCLILPAAIAGLTARRRRR